MKTILENVKNISEENFTHSKRALIESGEEGEDLEV